MAESDWHVLRDLLSHRAERDPSGLAFAAGADQLTFADLAERADARAGGLHAVGVRHGDRVVLEMSAGLPLVEMFWALQVLGATPCVINPSLPAPTLARRAALVQPSLVVDDHAAREMPRGAAPPPDLAPAPEDVAFLQLTSGTTGEPRASMILHRNVLAYLRTSRSHRRLAADDVFVSWVPPWHDFGLVRFIIGAVYHGASCHLVEPAVRTIPEWLATISRVGGTFSAAPDFAYRLAVRMVDPAAIDLSSLRMLKSGGEPVRRATIAAFEERFGVKGVMAPGYGLGEATLGVTEHLSGEEIAVDEHGNVSCGTANPGLQVRAGDSPDAPREITVRGEPVFAGYFDAPAETAQVLRDGWLHTGDCGYLDCSGRLFVLGRRAGMIKRAGALIAPRELEEAAQRVDDVRVVAATSLPSPQNDSDVIVVAVETGGKRPPDTVARDVTRQIVGALGFAPSEVRVLAPRSIPRTENGKIRHSHLRALLQDDLPARHPEG